jgi:hypothetical protein
VGESYAVTADDLAVHPDGPALYLEDSALSIGNILEAGAHQVHAMLITVAKIFLLYGHRYEFSD